MWHRPNNILVNVTDPTHQSCTAYHKATPAAAAKMKPIPTVHRMLTTKKRIPSNSDETRFVFL